MRASLTFSLLLIGLSLAKYTPFEDKHQKIHVEISDYTPFTPSSDYHYCLHDNLRIDVYVSGVDVRKQAINFYDFDDLCCDDDKPTHRPIDQIVCLMPKV